MEILIAVGVVLGFVIAGKTIGSVRKKHIESDMRIPQKEMAQINLLLQNIEAYDGTAKGQKKIGGEK